MSNATKSSQKKFISKVHQVVESNLFKSIAIASILFNVLFFAALIVLTSTNTFDRKVYLGAKGNYCKNIDGIRQRSKELGSEKKALQEWQVSCVSKEFAPYYKEALDKFHAQNQ